MIILDGKKVANEETEKLKKDFSKLLKTPSIVIFQVGASQSSNKYIANKIKKADELGVEVKHLVYSENISEKELINNIKNSQINYDGAIVQLPLPNHIDKQNVLDAIELSKDIDGLSTLSMNNFYNDKDDYSIPATARGILLLLNYYDVNLDQNIMVIGESNLVGKPTKHLLSKHTTKSIVSRNKRTGIKDSENYDILVIAAGSPKLIGKNNIKNNAVVVDVGINVVEGEIVGDVDFEDVKDKVSAISPVPGGVGPLTVVCLFKNLFDKISLNEKRKD